MNLFKPLRSLKAFCFDVDGVFTDNRIIIQEDGAQIRTMNIRDGIAVKQALNQDYPVGIITAGSSEGVVHRFGYLGVDFVEIRVKNKLEVFKSFLVKYGLEKNEVLYMGDDGLDREILTEVGFGCCPANADHDIKEICRYISPFAGGEGCVRDVIEKTLRLHNKWML